MKRRLALGLLLAACGTPPAAESSPPAPAAAPPPVVPRVEEDASAPVPEIADASAASDAGAASVEAGTDAAAPAVAERPLELKGARRCSDEELDLEVCFEGKKTGLCREGSCTSPAICPKYCSALAKRLHEDCMIEPEPECKKIPECMGTFRTLKATCKKLIGETTSDCLRLVCDYMRHLPPPPA